MTYFLQFIQYTSDRKNEVLSELILASSAVFWNRFRIVGPESVFGIGSGIDSRIGTDSGIKIGSRIGIGA